MTTPLLATRDALVNALVGKTIGAMESVGRLTAEEIADALAGVVRDPATLADDEALVERVAADQKEAADSWGDPLPGAELSMRARTALRALTAALTEDPS